MGLLNAQERLELARLLTEHPDVTNPQFRDALLANLPHSVLVRIPNGNIASYHITQIIQTVDGSVDLDNARLSDGSWPLLVLLDNAVEYSRGNGLAAQLEKLRDVARQQAFKKALHMPANFASATPSAVETLERIANARGQFVDPQVAIRRLTQIIRAVCRIELPTAWGSGFLVGPDLVLTNYHVVEDLIDQRVRQDDVHLRFDYLYPGPGERGAEGTLYRLAPEGVLCHSTLAELDFALLRLADSIADFAIQGKPGVTGRGWLVPSPQTEAIAPNTPLFILQHPVGRRLESAYGWVLSHTTNPDRMQYTANTEIGSSGSPCFNDSWELIALHHASVEKANQGVPISAILEREDVRQALAV